MSNVIVRIPPSPTGFFHIGTARTALYNYLFAKQHGGKIILRMEDTDKERSEKRFEDDIVSGIQKLGMSWDGDIVRQSERTEIYKKYLHTLVDEGKAYFCFCTVEELDEYRAQAEKEKRAFRYPGIWRDEDSKKVEEKLKNGEKYVIRFRIPENTGDITFTDHIRGEVTIHAKELDDFVIAKDFDTPLYNFCVVIDDHEMNISHVIRGEDHISNTPKQVLLYEAFGWKSPEHAHLPLILNQDKSKLSKRKNKVSVDDYLEEGYLPEALLNFLALLGWNTSDEEEIFSLNDLIEKFSLDRVHKGGAVFDLEKLTHLNGVWIRKKSLEEFAELTLSFLQRQESHSLYKEVLEYAQHDKEFFLKTLSLIHERTKKLSEVPEFIRFFFIGDEKLEYSTSIYEHKKMGTSAENAEKSLLFSLDILETYTDKWSIEALKNYFFEKIKTAELKNGFILYPLRVALSGEEFSPGTFELLEIFGKERSIARLKRGLEILK